MSRARLLAVAAGCLLAACGGQGSARQAETLASLAAEGALLAADVSGSDTTAAFARVHARELGDAASQIDGAPASADVAALARRLARLLDRLATTAPGDPAAGRLERALARAGDDARRLAGR